MRIQRKGFIQDARAIDLDVDLAAARLAHIINLEVIA